VEACSLLLEPLACYISVVYHTCRCYCSWNITSILIYRSSPQTPTSMAPSRAHLLRVARSIHARSTIPRICARRSLATAANTKTNAGPLAGIRVLDMTRVLAGVCVTCQFPIGPGPHTYLTHTDAWRYRSHTVRKCWATWGERTLILHSAKARLTNTDIAAAI
jgi:hypothetical protein